MKGLLTVFFALIFLGSCSEEKLPAKVLREDVMINLLTDIQLVDGYTNSTVADTLSKYGPMMYSSVLKRYHTDSAGFSRSLKYYSGDPVRLSGMYKKVRLKLQRLEKAEQRRLTKESIDTAKHAR